MTTVLFGQLTREVETQSGAADSPGLGILPANEAPENLRLLALWYANAVVLDTEMNRLACCLFPKGDDDRAAPRTVLDGVANQIEQHLFNAPWIDICHQ